MMQWLLTAVVAVLCLSRAESACSNAPCTETDYRSYSNCLSKQCPNTVVATGCPESKCSSINCNSCSNSNACCQSCCSSSSCDCKSVSCNSCSTSNACCNSCCQKSNCECSSISCNSCPSSNACCNSCCQKSNQCECQSLDCNSCQGSCCQSCCPQQDCCKSNQKQDCCTKNPSNNCCITQPAPQPIIPNINLPNITIFINQTPAIIYNSPNFSVNHTCGGITTIRNDSHITMTTAPCQNVSNPTQPCCRIPYRLPCYTNVQVPYQQCPIRYQQACGPQCINRPISQVVQPPVILPQPTCQPPYCPQPPPVYQPPIYQPPVYQPPVYLPQPICQQPYCPQPPPVYQPPVYQPPVYQPPVYQPPVYQPPVSGCYINYPSPCPPQCLGACTYVPLQTGCAPLNQWPFLRCAPGNSYSYLGGYGGIGGYGTPGAGGYGAPGIGSYGTPGITPGIGGIGGVQPGQPFVG